jgi:hypothetical protein
LIVFVVYVFDPTLRLAPKARLEPRKRRPQGGK